MLAADFCLPSFCRRGASRAHGKRLLLVTLLISLLGLLAAPPAAANGFLDGTVSTGWENNLTRGFWRRDQHNSPFLRARLDAGKLYQPITNISLIVSGSLSYDYFSSLQGLNRFGVGASVTAQQKFGMGPYSPRLSLTARAERDDLRGAERDRYLYNLEVGLSKRLSQSWSASLGAARETSRGFNEKPVDFTLLPYTPGNTRPTDPMDYYNNVFFGSADYEFASGWLLTLTRQYVDGYIVPTAVPPVVPQYLKAKAVAIDPAFQQRHLLYPLKSRNRSWGLNLSVPLSDDSALDFGYTRQEVDAHHVGTYRNYQLGVSLLHRF